MKFQALSPQRVERLGKEAREDYERGLAAVDKINYEKALEHFTAAVEKEPENPYLRFELVQVAQYFGDTRSGSESIKYYDLAALNLKAIAESPRLNAREKERAEKALQMVGELRQSVLERDEKRIQFGRDIAKQHAREIYEKEEAEKEKEERAKRKRPPIPGEATSTDVENRGETTTKQERSAGAVAGEQPLP